MTCEGAEESLRRHGQHVRQPVRARLQHANLEGGARDALELPLSAEGRNGAAVGLHGRVERHIAREIDGKQ